MGIIVFDIDGTLSIVGDRLRHLENKDWDSFYKACGEDEVNEPIAKVCRALMINNEIIFVTGRREGVRGKTIRWLINNRLWDNSHMLLMRRDGDKRHDTIVKPELVHHFIDNIEMIFEDRASMVEKWRELGITTLQVAEGNF